MLSHFLWKLYHFLNLRFPVCVCQRVIIWIRYFFVQALYSTNSGLMKPSKQEMLAPTFNDDEQKWLTIQMKSPDIQKIMQTNPSCIPETDMTGKLTKVK